jgi:hypothetical protein
MTSRLAGNRLPLRLSVVTVGATTASLPAVDIGSTVWVTFNADAAS